MSKHQLDQIRIVDDIADEDWILVDDSPTFGTPAVTIRFDGMDIEISELRVMHRNGVVRLHDWLGRWLARNP